MKPERLSGGPDAVADRSAVVGLDGPLWRALVVFRIAALGYAAVLMVSNFRQYYWPLGGWLVVGVMAVWTVVVSLGYGRPDRRGWPLLVADLLVTAGCLLASRWIVRPEGLGVGSPTLPMIWVAGPVVAWAISGGRRRGLLAAVVMVGADTVVRDGISQATVNGAVLLLLTGVIIGHIARLAIDAGARLQRAVELEAVTRERERLARRIHDSVLQVLALVQRRGAELGGEAAELGRLAGEQEAALRALVSPDRAGGVVPDRAPSDGRSGPDPLVDLRAAVHRYAVAGVSVAAPATPVCLPAPVAAEIAAAVAAALDNVRAHAGSGAKVWLLIEELDGAVSVSIRDDGAGMTDNRLAQAEADGRLGIAQSIKGRVRDLGGTVTITSSPGRGTEVELRVPTDHPPPP